MRSIRGDRLSLILSDNGGVLGLVDEEPLSDTVIYPSNRSHRILHGQQCHYPPDNAQTERHTAELLASINRSAA